MLRVVPLYLWTPFPSKRLLRVKLFLLTFNNSVFLGLHNSSHKQVQLCPLDTYKGWSLVALFTKPYSIFSSWQQTKYGLEQ